MIEEVAYLRDISFVPCRASLVSFRSKIVCLCLMKLVFFFFFVPVCVCIHECVAIYRCVCVYTCVCVSSYLKECTETIETYKKLGSICFFIIQQLAVMGLIPQEVTRGAVRESSKKGNVEAC